MNVPKVRFLLLIMGCLNFHSLLLAQTNKQVTPGTFSRLPTQISPLATSTGLQQFYSATGHYTISADGIGSRSSSMNIRIYKPNAQATVEKAVLISSVTHGTIDNGCVTIAGVPVNWDGTAAVAFFNNYWADVTSIVDSTINAFPAGISTLPIAECNTVITEGEVLLVIFNDPSATEKTIIIMLGAQNSQGDNFSVTLAQPIDPTAPGSLLDMGLGIGYSYQLNISNQRSQVSINNQRMSSSAGGEDDGTSANGALLTVGGIGDANDNPPDPFAFPANPRSDDELYSILPFITDSTTSLTVNTINPSLDDNIFLAYFVTSKAAIVGEGILLSQTSDSGDLGDDHTVTAILVDSLGQPLAGKPVTFTVTAGPNAGNTFSATSDANGNAFYTYAGTGGSGTDSIRACFTNSQSETSCSNTLSFAWTTGLDSCMKVCIIDSYRDKWNLCATRTGSMATATGTVNIGNGIIWKAWGWIDCNTGRIELHAINPQGDNCASGYVDSFVFRGITPTKCNTGNIHIGGARWTSYCGASIAGRGLVAGVNCGISLPNGFSNDVITPARSGGAETIVLKAMPNPVQHYTTIHYKLETESKVNITVFNYQMQPVKTLFSGTRSAGNRAVAWDAKNANGRAAGSGFYLIVAVINGKSYSTTVQVVK